MKKLFLMLALILGMMSCDKKNDNETYTSISEFEQFIIGPSGNYIIIKDLLNSEDSYSYCDEDVFVVVYNHFDVRYSISLKDDYGCIIVVNCSVNNKLIDYTSFKIKLLTSYNKNVRN